MRLFITLLLSGIYLCSIAQDTITLKEAVAIALEKNYNIRIAENNLDVAENNVTPGNAGFLPTLDLTATNNNAIVNGEQIRGDQSEDIDDGKNKSTVVGADLNWTIFDGTRMFINNNLLETQRLYSETELNYQIEQTIYDVTNNYLLAALEQERLNSLESNLELSGQRLKIANDRYELGKGSKLEYLQAQVDYNADRSEMLTQIEVLETQKLALLELLSITDTATFNLKSDVNIDRGLNLSELLNAVTSQNARLVPLEKLKQIASLETNMLKTSRVPSISVFTGYNYSETQRAVGFTFESNTTELSYGFTAAITVFNGFNLNRQIQNATIAEETAQFNYEQQALAVKTQLKSAFVSYLNNIELIELEGENLEVARENNEIAQDRYEIGLSTALELREAQVNLINAELRRQNAVFAAKLAEIQLKFLSGRSIRER